MTEESIVSALVASGVAGQIQTPAQDVLRKAQALAAGSSDALFGLERLLPTQTGEVLDALERLGGWRPGEGDYGGSHADPARLVEHAVRAAERLRLACERGERVLFGTGHPTGPLAMYLRLADRLHARGAEIVHGAEDRAFRLDGRNHYVRFVGDVACLTSGADLVHTHSAEPMRFLWPTVQRPHLFVGDHGFAGVALAEGVEAVAIADTNDPALVLAWARGLPIVPLLCDDNRLPRDYEPLLEVLTSGL